MSIFEEQAQALHDEMVRDYEGLDDAQKGQLQFILDQLQDPEGLRVFNIPRSGLIDTYKFPMFMSLFLIWRGVTDYYVFDMRPLDVVILTFYTDD